MSDLRRIEDVKAAKSWKRLIYDVFKTSDSQRLEDVRFNGLEDVQFTTSWSRLIYDVLKMSDLWRLEDVCKITSV